MREEERKIRKGRSGCREKKGKKRQGEEHSDLKEEKWGPRKRKSLKITE